MNKNVVGYVRVSTERQEKKGMSIQNQKEKIQEYCSLMDLSLDEIIVEVKSGKDDNREGYNRILEMEHLYLDDSKNYMDFYNRMLENGIVDLENLSIPFN